MALLVPLDEEVDDGVLGLEAAPVEGLVAERLAVEDLGPAGVVGDEPGDGLDAGPEAGGLVVAGRVDVGEDRGAEQGGLLVVDGEEQLVAVGEALVEVRAG